MAKKQYAAKLRDPTHKPYVTFKIFYRSLAALFLSNIVNSSGKFGHIDGLDLVMSEHSAALTKKREKETKKVWKTEPMVDHSAHPSTKDDEKEGLLKKAAETPKKPGVYKRALSRTRDIFRSGKKKDSASDNMMRRGRSPSPAERRALTNKSLPPPPESPSSPSDRHGRPQGGRKNMDTEETSKMSLPAQAADLETPVRLRPDQRMRQIAEQSPVVPSTYEFAASARDLISPAGPPPFRIGRAMPATVDTGARRVTITNADGTIVSGGPAQQSCNIVRRSRLAGDLPAVPAERQLSDDDDEDVDAQREKERAARLRQAQYNNNLSEIFSPRPVRPGTFIASTVARSFGRSATLSPIDEESEPEEPENIAHMSPLAAPPTREIRRPTQRVMNQEAAPNLPSSDAFGSMPRPRRPSTPAATSRPRVLSYVSSYRDSDDESSDFIPYPARLRGLTHSRSSQLPLLSRSEHDDSDNDDNQPRPDEDANRMLPSPVPLLSRWDRNALDDGRDPPSSPEIADNRMSSSPFPFLSHSDYDDSDIEDDYPRPDQDSNRARSESLDFFKSQGGGFRDHFGHVNIRGTTPIPGPSAPAHEASALRFLGPDSAIDPDVRKRVARAYRIRNSVAMDTLEAYANHGRESRPRPCDAEAPRQSGQFEDNGNGTGHVHGHGDPAMDGLLDLYDEISHRPSNRFTRGMGGAFQGLGRRLDGRMASNPDEEGWTLGPDGIIANGRSEPHGGMMRPHLERYGGEVEGPRDFNEALDQGQNTPSEYESARGSSVRRSTLSSYHSNDRTAFGTPPPGMALDLEARRRSIADNSFFNAPTLIDSPLPVVPRFPPRSDTPRPLDYMPLPFMTSRPYNPRFRMGSLMQPAPRPRQGSLLQPLARPRQGSLLQSLMRDDPPPPPRFMGSNRLGPGAPPPGHRPSPSILLDNPLHAESRYPIQPSLDRPIQRRLTMPSVPAGMRDLFPPRPRGPSYTQPSQLQQEPTIADQRLQHFLQHSDEAGNPDVPVSRPPSANGDSDDCTDAPLPDSISQRSISEHGRSEEGDGSEYWQDNSGNGGLYNAGQAARQARQAAPQQQQAGPRRMTTRARRDVGEAFERMRLEYGDYEENEHDR